MNKYKRVSQITDLIEEGVTEPLKCFLEDGTEVIIKYPKNRIGTQVLINEYISACIADEIGLDIPGFGICILSNDIIENSDADIYLTEDNAGLCFYSEFHSSSAPVTRGLMASMKPEISNLARLIIFDCIICNKDRHQGNLLIDYLGNAKILAIDHGTIFTTTDASKYSADQIADQVKNSELNVCDVLKSNEEQYDLLMRTAEFETEIWREYSLLKEKLTDELFEKIRNSIPKEWIIELGNDIINNLFTLIRFRVKNLKEICVKITEERK